MLVFRFLDSLFRCLPTYGQDNFLDSPYLWLYIFVNCHSINLSTCLLVKPQWILREVLGTSWSIFHYCNTEPLLMLIKSSFHYLNQLPFCYKIMDVLHWFLDVKPTLNSWNKSHFVIVYNSFYMFWFSRILLSILNLYLQWMKRKKGNIFHTKMKEK